MTSPASETVVYESPGSWLQVIQTANGYYFSRRKNRNSVAVFLVRQPDPKKDWEVLVRMQPLPIHNSLPGEEMQLFPCPITGGLDNPNEDPEECAIREALEEAGYQIELDELVYLCNYLVGTQTDETVYVYYADVTDLKPIEATQDGTVFEAASKNVWHDLEYLYRTNYSANLIAYFRLREELHG